MNKQFKFSVDVTGILEIQIAAASRNKARMILEEYLDSGLHMDNKVFPEEFTEVSEDLQGEVFKSED